MSQLGVTLLLTFCAGTALLLFALRLHSSTQHRYLRRVEGMFKLNRKQRSLIERLATAAELPDQSTILLVPSLFDAAVERLNPDFDELVEIQDLRRQILTVDASELF